MMSTAYLIGSGFSIPFGLPSLNDLTEYILKENKYYTEHTSGIFYRRDNQIINSNSQNEILLKTVFDFLKNPNRPFSVINPSYEDIVDCLMQYNYSISKEYENPSLDSIFLQKLYSVVPDHKSYTS